MGATLNFSQANVKLERAVHENDLGGAQEALALGANVDREIWYNPNSLAEAFGQVKIDRNFWLKQLLFLPCTCIRCIIVALILTLYLGLLACFFVLCAPCGIWGYRERNNTAKIATEQFDIEEGLTPTYFGVASRGDHWWIKYSRGITPLGYAARKGFAEMAQVLLNANANTEARDKLCKLTPLGWAVLQGYPGVMLKLIEHGAKVDSRLLKVAKKNALAEVASLLARIDGNIIEAEFLKQGRFFPVFVCTREDFLKMGRIKKHEIALQEDIVVQLPEGAVVLFFSQRWLAGQKNLEEEPFGEGPHPDTAHNFKYAAMCQAILVHFPHITHVWLDYVCVPQLAENSEQQLFAINSLPYIVRQCSEFVVLKGVSGVKNRANKDEASYEVYNSRGWCRLECLSAAAPSSEQKPPINTWICDMNEHTIIRLELSNPCDYDPLADNAVFFDEKDKKKIAQTVVNLTEIFVRDTEGLLQVKKNAIRYLPEDLKSKYS